MSNKDAIIECFEELLSEYEEIACHAPNAQEEAELWREAEELAMERAIAHAENLNDQERDA